MTHRGRKQRIRLFYSYVACLVVLSLSVLAMPFGVKITDQTKVLTYICGTLFWFALLGTITTAIIITSSRRRSKWFHRAMHKEKRLGLIHFFQNKEAMVFDILMFISLTGLIINHFIMRTNEITFLFISLLIFSFGMHCMLNGSNYLYIKHKSRREIKS